MKCIVALLILFSLGSCSAQLEEKATTNPEAETEVLSEVEKHYQLNDTVHEASISKGSVRKQFPSMFVGAFHEAKMSIGQKAVKCFVSR